MIIGNKNTDEKPLIIAEIGNNHEGDFDTAVKLIHEAAAAGVDGVKFQTFKTEHYVSRTDKARFERLKSFELTQNQFKELSELAHSLNLLFISTPFDIESARFLEPLIDAYKISSGDINFYPLIDVIKKTKKPIILSTGACDIDLVKRTVDYVNNDPYPRDSDKLAILHCISCYPVPPEQVNLQSILFLSEEFDCTVGYSDHTTGNDASLAAIGFGAKIIEKHFTLCHTFSSFRDHQLSSDPKEMAELVQKANYISVISGKRKKEIQPCEMDIIKAFRRSIVAAREITKGETISISDITWTRPAGGIPPGEENRILGKKILNGKQTGEMILEDDIE
ncbi:MAG: N-acetylneuraminate synthase family protein [Methanomicrobiaceae archaeon]|nr:N-acetylneuraminate synthase family protein [Methanomicrobiaceae archaeon]